MKGRGRLPRLKKPKTGNEPLPANQQKGEKKCNFCHETKKVTSFYISKNPLHSADERVPICKDCVMKASLNEDGTINDLEFNKILKAIDRPYYKDIIESSVQSFAKEHSYIEEDKIKFYGKEILSIYFRCIAMRQDREKSYEDSEKDGFMHQNNNRPKSAKERIAQKYADINEKPDEDTDSPTGNTETKWTKKDKQNMKYVISTIGYDPYEDIGLVDADRKYCYNILSGYCDTDGISEDGHKMQGVIEMTMLYCQCKKITETMNIELAKEEPDDAKIQKLTASKTSLLSSIATIAKDNNIASNYNKNSKQGQSSLTSKMKEMAENGYQEIAVNLFDIKTSEAFRQIDEISNNNIANQLTLDNNEYSEIVKEQREMIQKYDVELEAIKEENRILKNKIIDLENKKR